ncbi:MAG TPA: sigma-54 dependent transcriptional regulator [Steroidobacteraceae bacterium]|nr:sigma-54 dependent transcriptional regulator [Steroidobacteraceae bacterium]
MIATSALRTPVVQGSTYPTGTSSGAIRVRDQIQRVAGFNTSVLILGESGTGKERVAQEIHRLSPRRERPFVPVNCGAIPADLLESELFGHEKGAFTGAVTARAGRFEIADGGTLFLDEIGEMSPTMQVKLLRVLQERRFERVGGSAPRSCDVRIIAATHRRLDRDVESGGFRLDLYFRLNVFPIEVPRLSERVVDLPQLIDECNGELFARGHEPVRLAPDACAALARNAWPGNVRELGNLLERLSIAHPGERIVAALLPAVYQATGQDGDESRAPAAQDFATGSQPVFTDHGALAPLPELPDGGLCLKSMLDDIEQRFISQAMARAGGVISEAARLLGLRRTTLTEKLRRPATAAARAATTQIVGGLEAG